MPKIFKPQNVVSIDVPAVIPDYIPPAPPVVELPDIDNMNIEDENIRKQYELIMERARLKAENMAESIIEQSETEKQNIISISESKADSIVEAANEKSKEIIQNAIQQAEKIRTDAYNEAAQKAIDEKNAEVNSIINEFRSVLEDMKAAQLDYFERYAVEMKMLALDISEKVIMHKVEEDDLLMLDLIAKNIKSIRDADWITIEISNKLPQLAEAIERAMESVGMSDKTEIQQIASKDKSSCILRATDRIVDISLKTQLNNIRSYFEKCDETDD